MPGAERDALSSPRAALALFDHALTPQAKGRVDRANQTLQDRLIMDMQLSNISSIEAALAFLPEFILKYNEKFGFPPPTRPRRPPWTKTAATGRALAARGVLTRR